MNYNYSGLTNEQIVFIYMESKARLDNYNKFIEEPVISKALETPMGTVHMLTRLSDAEVEQFKESIPYQMCKGTVASLQPVVELITEAQDMKHIMEHYKNVA
jgi:hypothetical protein